MGWSTGWRRKGETMTQTLINNGHLRWSDDPSIPYTMKVIDSAFVTLSEHYSAIEKVDKVTGQRSVFCSIIIVNLFKEDRNGYNYSVKGIGSYDSMYPNCPERILALLSPPTEQRDIEWRAACREKAAIRKEISLPAGAEFYTKNPIKFGDGVQDDAFFVIENKGSAVICQMKNLGFRCRLSRNSLLSLHEKQEFSMQPFLKPVTEPDATNNTEVEQIKPNVNSMKI